MQDRPTYNELLEAVHNFLENEVVPALEGPRKFHARVAANVLTLIRRELSLEELQASSEWHGLDQLLGPVEQPSDKRATRRALRQRTEQLCQRIRNGDADSGAWRTEVLAHVRQTVIDKLAVTNPKYLGDEIEHASNSPAAKD